MKKKIIYLIICLVILLTTIIVVNIDKNKNKENTSSSSTIIISSYYYENISSLIDYDNHYSSMKEIIDTKSSAKKVETTSSIKKNESISSTKKVEITSSIKKNDPPSSSKKIEQTGSNNGNETTSSNKIIESTSSIQKTQVQINDEYRKSLETKYNINIKYGNEMNDYEIYGVIPTYLDNPSDVYTNLNQVNTSLGYYPTGFFKEMKDHDTPLTLYLVYDVPGVDIAGLTDHQFGDNIIITLCTNEMIFRYIHHEIFHYIETYMSFEDYHEPATLFKNWNNYNPSEYSYGSFISSYNYDRFTVGDYYFINNYGQTNDREDRATIFEDLMARTEYNELPHSFIEGNHLWDKAKYISDEIDRIFTCVNSSTTERWERMLYN